MDKAQSPKSWYDEHANNPEESGENPYEATSEFESGNGLAGGRPGVNLSIKGAKPYGSPEYD